MQYGETAQRCTREFYGTNEEVITVAKYFPNGHSALATEEDWYEEIEETPEVYLIDFDITSEE